MKKLFGFFAVMLFVACGGGKTVYVQDYITEDMTNDAYPAIRLALEEAL